MIDNDIYSKNLDAAVRRSAGVTLPPGKIPSTEKASREAALRLRRDRSRQRATAMGHEDEPFSFCETDLELTEEEYREYAAFLEESRHEASSVPQQSEHTLGLQGTESLGGAFTNEKSVTGQARHSDPNAVTNLLRSGHREAAYDEDKALNGPTRENATETSRHREFVARVFVFCLFFGMIALVYWPG